MANAAGLVARNQPYRAEVTRSGRNAIRRLGTLEHLFWLYDQHRSSHFAVTALISGQASPRDWRKALDRLQKRHPILSVCIAAEAGSVPTFRPADVAPIPLRIVNDEPERRWEAEVAEELATPFDSSRAPLIRAVLIQRARDAAFILLAHHSIADGLSLAYVIRDTLEALAGRPLPPLAWLPSQDDMTSASEGFADAQEQDRPRALMPVFHRPRDNARPTVKAARLSPALTASIRERARQEGTTVHGALCAALVLASRDALDVPREIPLRIFSPLNARAPEAGESCGLFLGAAASVFDRQTAGFWDIAREAKAGIAANSTPEHMAARLAFLRRAVGNGADVARAAAIGAELFRGEFVLTNLGSLSLNQKFGPFTLKAMFGPAVLTGLAGQQTIGVSTINGSLCLLQTSHTPLEGLLEETQDVLTQATGERG
jgi:hypothetical protein